MIMLSFFNQKSSLWAKAKIMFFSDVVVLACLSVLLLTGCGQPSPKKEPVVHPTRGCVDGVIFDASTRSIKGEGWVFSPDDPVQGLVVLLGGQPLQTNSPSFGPRPDVARYCNDTRAVSSGWSFAVPLPANLPANGYLVTVQANLASGEKFELASSGASLLVNVPPVSRLSPSLGASKKDDAKNKKSK
jgi:hypothetical protein